MGEDSLDQRMKTVIILLSFWLTLYGSLFVSWSSPFSCLSIYEKSRNKKWCWGFPWRVRIYIVRWPLKIEMDFRQFLAELFCKWSAILRYRSRLANLWIYFVNRDSALSWSQRKKRPHQLDRLRGENDIARSQMADLLNGSGCESNAKSLRSSAQWF